jgi:hypothetical protein
VEKNFTSPNLGRVEAILEGESSPPKTPVPAAGLSPADLAKYGPDGPPGKGGPFTPTGRVKGIPNRATREALALLASAAPDLAARLVKLAEPIRPGAKCGVCGAGMERPEEFQLKAITTVLDRSGIGPHQKVEVEQKADLSFVDYLTPEELVTVDEIYERAAQRQAQHMNQQVSSYADLGSASSNVD